MEKEASSLTVVVCVIADTLRRNVAGVTDGGSVHSIRITYFLQSYRGHSGGGNSEGRRSVGTTIQSPLLSIHAEVINCFYSHLLNDPGTLWLWHCNKVLPCHKWLLHALRVKRSFRVYFKFKKKNCCHHAYICEYKGVFVLHTRCASRCAIN